MKKSNINEKKSVLNKISMEAANLGAKTTNATSNIIHITTTAAGSAGMAGVVMGGVATTANVLEQAINTCKPVTTLAKAKGLAGLTGKVVATTYQGGRVVAQATVSKAEGAAMAAANGPVSIPLVGVGAAAVLAGISAGVTYARISSGYRTAAKLQKEAKQRLQELDLTEEEVAEND
jgi:hypothetical protein